MSGAPKEIVEKLGGEEPFRFYESLVELDTTNLEDAKAGRVEKRNYQKACELVKAQAERWGFSAWTWDPTKDPDNVFPNHHNQPRPNVFVDYDVGAKDRLLIVAHYDCVPVPEAQRRLWKYDPFRLTFAEGRFFGRGANDDKGSGVFCALEAMRELKKEGARDVNIRMIAACDEETGGTGGLSAIVKKDALLRKRREKPMLEGSLAMLPDASPSVIAGSSGVTFSDLVVREPVPATNVSKLLARMIEFRAFAMRHKSTLDSPDWPDDSAPDPKITGRFTVTKLEFAARSERSGFRVRRIHAETDSYNTIPEIVTIDFDTTPEALETVERRLRELGELAKRVEIQEGKGDGIMEGRIILHGKGGHGGYPHRFDNPIDYAPKILNALFAESPGLVGTASLGFDMRTVPEEDPQIQLRELRAHVDSAIAAFAPSAKFEIPDHGVRPGYYVAPEHPSVRLLAFAVEAVSGKPAPAVGEYGGTDASFFSGIPDASGKPMVALLFGSMDKDANIHSWNENAKPELLRLNIDVLKWLATHWEGKR